MSVAGADFFAFCRKRVAVLVKAHWYKCLDARGLQIIGLGSRVPAMIRLHGPTATEGIRHAG